MPDTTYKSHLNFFSPASYLNMSADYTARVVARADIAAEKARKINRGDEK